MNLLHKTSTEQLRNYQQKMKEEILTLDDDYQTALKLFTELNGLAETSGLTHDDHQECLSALSEFLAVAYMQEPQKSIVD